MFIELTDHLRCPADHEESFLVLLPDRVEDRSVRTGQLGCPVCGRTFPLLDGVLDVGGAPEPSEGRGGPGAEALTALAGLSGPGGYLVVVGAPGREWRELAERNPGVGIVLANPPGEVRDEPGVSVLRGGMLPLKSRTMRGAILGRGYGNDAGWIGEGARVVLPGLRVVGQGPDPAPDRIDLMASADGIWVGSPRR
ncbi:MAG TPA: hypothetical protein VJQ44_12040 [Gemmatimonadales bacterium]|nr:hypothetical protein [Gemmatimonadales bacterium]